MIIAAIRRANRRHGQWQSKFIRRTCGSVQTRASRQCYQLNVPQICRGSGCDPSDRRTEMPKGHQRGNREMKKPKQPKKPVTPPGTFIPARPPKPR
jgi:hypothetical protein